MSMYVNVTTEVTASQIAQAMKDKEDLLFDVLGELAKRQPDPSIIVSYGWSGSNHHKAGMKFVAAVAEEIRKSGGV